MTPAIRRRAPRTRLGTWWTAIAVAAGLLLAAPGTARGHDVPADATVRILVEPGDGDRPLRVLVRAPLAAMRDVRFPLRGPGYLDLGRLGPELREAARTWIADYLRFFQDGAPLERGRVVAARASFSSDRSFGSWEEALSHVTGPPLPPGTDLHLDGASLDVLVAYPIRPGAAPRFSVESGLAHLARETRTVLRYSDPGGEVRVLRFTGNPGRVHLDPRWHETGLRFLESGLGGFLGDVEHLLFVLVLVLPFGTPGALVPVTVAFAVGGAITLAAGPLGLAPAGLWFPPLVETVVAASVLYLALENILGARPERRWPAAFGFGLVHGLVLSFPLAEEFPFAGEHGAAAVAAFAGGVELAILLTVLVAVPALRWLFRGPVPERLGVVVLSALVAHEAWHWTLDRGGALGAHRLPSPTLDAAFLAGAMRWAMAALALGGVAWLLSGLFERWGLRERREPAEDAGSGARREGGEERTLSS